MKNIEVIFQVKFTINTEAQDSFIERHKSYLDTGEKDEIEIKKLIYKCVRKDEKEGIFVHMTFCGDDNGQPYVHRVNYMNPVTPKKAFYVSTRTKNNQWNYELYPLEIIAENSEKYLVKYPLGEREFNEIQHRESVISHKEKANFERKLQKLKVAREKLIIAEGYFYKFQ